MVARFNLDLEKKQAGAPPGSSNYVNTRKLFNVLSQKNINSELADSSIRSRTKENKRGCGRRL
jgi:hypothetical protein